DVLVAMLNLSHNMCKVVKDNNDIEALEYWSLRTAAYRREVERRGLENVSKSKVPERFVKLTPLSLACSTQISDGHRRCSSPATNSSSSFSCLSKFIASADGAGIARNHRFISPPASTNGSRRPTAGSLSAR